MTEKEKQALHDEYTPASEYCRRCKLAGIALGRAIMLHKKIGRLKKQNKRLRQRIAGLKK